MIPAAGATFAGFRIEALAGRGGMGSVYRARDARLGRLVALKVIAAEVATDPAFRARFVAEARLAAAIDHPNVVPVYGAGEEQGCPWIAMRWVDGADLARLIAVGGPLAPSLAAGVVAQAAAALAAAHARGLVHRDVKPANLLVARDGHVLLATSVSRATRRARSRRRAPAVCSARPATALPSRCAASGWVRRPTSTRSAACSSRR